MPPCEEHEPLHDNPLAGLIDRVPGELLKFTRAPLTFTTELPLMKSAEPFLMSSLPPLRIEKRSPLTSRRLPDTRTACPELIVSVPPSSRTNGPVAVSFAF